MTMMTYMEGSMCGTSCFGRGNMKKHVGYGQWKDIHSELATKVQSCCFFFYNFIVYMKNIVCHTYPRFPSNLIVIQLNMNSILVYYTFIDIALSLCDSKQK